MNAKYPNQFPLPGGSKPLTALFPTRMGTNLLKHLALAVTLGAGLGIGTAQAQTVLQVGGINTIADEVLPTNKLPGGGVNWTAAGGNGNTFSSLISPSATVAASGAVTLTFTHRYNFEQDASGNWDGGAVYASLNNGPFTKVTSFSSNGYNGTALASVWPLGEQIFAGQSTDWGLSTLITTVADLGNLTAGDKVAVEFRGGWDQNTFPSSPNWEIGTVQISDTGGALLNSNFATGGRSGFTASTTGTGTSPWKYAQDISEFEINADLLTADRYAPSAPGGAIDLNNADISVFLLSGTLDPNDTFTLFDLSGGTTLTGSVNSIKLPFGNWDTSNLAVNGTIKYVSTPPPTYIGPNTTGDVNTWNTATNWSSGSVPSGATEIVIPDGAFVGAKDVNTPAYTGNLSIGAGATLQIGWTTAISQSYNALGTPGSTTISMGAGALISTRNGGSPIVPAITLLGNAKIRLGESTQVPANADFNYPVTGAYTFTIESNQQTPTIDLNAANNISALVINTLSGRGLSAGTFNANIAGCLGNGPITINPNGSASHKLAFKVAGASTAANTLNLYGEGPAANGVGRIRMDANNTVGALTIYGFAYPAGTYGRVGSPGAPTYQVGWIEGDSVLTVATAPADSSPPTVAITDNFPSGSILLGQKITYTLTFSEVVQASTVGTDDFENAGSAPVTINSVTPDLTFSVYKVVVTPSATGSVQLRVKSDAVITDLFGNNLVVPVTDDSTITVNPLTLKGQLGVWKQYANGGINPATGNPWQAGDTYRLAFVTNTGRDATSTDITVYNTFVQGVADASVAFPDLGNATWKVMGSTATVNAKTNTGTDPVVDGTGVAVLLMDGSTLFASNNTDLWNGTAARPDLTGVFMAPYLNEEGVEPASDASIFTGSTQAGVKGTDGRELGGSTEVPPKVTTGLKRPNNANRWMVQFNAAATSSLRFYALSEPLTVQAIGGGNTFADWIGTYPGVGGLTGVGDDADGDGIDNGVENFFGTNPSVSNTGLVSGAVTATTFSFTHPQNATPASDLTAAYQWSKDLASFFASGASDGSTTVTFTTQSDTPAPGTTTVTATLTGAATSKLFVNIKVTQN